MKKVLAAIGGFFVRIWRWVKETAWIQPLLIVGVIFAVIFSIPSITGWIQGIAEDINSPATYYKKYKKSLEGEENSDAQKLVDAMLNQSSTYGEKYVLILVQETCSSCGELQPAVDLIFKNKNDSYFDSSAYGDFKFFTIFTDEVVDSEETTTAWERFLERNSPFLERSAEVAENSWYYSNGNYEEGKITGLQDGSSMATPTLFFFDKTPSNTGEIGISELMFSVPGETSNDKAELLASGWTHTGEFAQV